MDNELDDVTKKQTYHGYSFTSHVNGDLSLDSELTNVKDVIVGNMFQLIRNDLGVLTFKKVTDIDGSK
jgi:hypothetical protein